MATKKEEIKWLFVYIKDSGEIDTADNEIYGFFTESEFLKDIDNDCKYGRFNLKDLKKIRVDSKIVEIP